MSTTSMQMLCGVFGSYPEADDCPALLEDADGVAVRRIHCVDGAAVLSRAIVPRSGVHHPEVGAVQVPGVLLAGRSICLWPAHRQLRLVHPLPNLCATDNHRVVLNASVSGFEKHYGA